MNICNINTSDRIGSGQKLNHFCLFNQSIAIHVHFLKQLLLRDMLLL
jgi:hypothetical protein